MSTVFHDKNPFELEPGRPLIDPVVEEEDFRPPPEPRLPGSMPMAIIINVLLVGAVAWGIQWQGDGNDELALAAQGKTVPIAQEETTPVVQAMTTAVAGTACPIRPLLGPASAKDGQVLPPADVDGKTAKDFDASLVAGKEAAAAGRVRDAEVDFLTSCRVADALKGAGSLESAEARYQLARHYVAVAGAQGAGPINGRADVFEQAQAYYADSLQRFRAQWGDANDKTRFAAEGLNAARVALNQQTPAPVEAQAAATARMGASPAAAPPVSERRPAPERPRNVVAHVTAGGKIAKAQPTVAAAAPQSAASPKPSFDCRKARSWAERTICSDSELAQLDRETGRLYARAKQAADDPAAFKRQSDAQWHRREKVCRDRACLVRWFTQRRQQLTESLRSEASALPERTASR